MGFQRGDKPEHYDLKKLQRLCREFQALAKAIEQLSFFMATGKRLSE